MRKAYLMARAGNGGDCEELSRHQEFLIDSGGRIVELARGRFSGDVLVSEALPEAAAAKTFELMNDLRVRVIFNAAFISGAAFARPDIIERDADSGVWRIIDVKCVAYHKGGLKRPRGRTGRYFTEAAYALMVMKLCGVRVGGVFAMFVSRRYRLYQSESEMFTVLDCTVEANKLAKSFEQFSQPIFDGLSAEQQPEAVITTICKNCGYYQGCPVSEIKHPVFLFNSINQKKFAQMIDDGYRSIDDIPDGYFKYPADYLYYMMRESVKSGRPFIGPHFKKALESVCWPAYYLDFESLASVLPVYEHSLPYEHLLVQYSLHIKESPACGPEGIRHFEYIVKPRRDCRRELFESLADNIGDTGSIIVYSDFEKLCIKRAAEKYPRIRERLNAMLERIFDLCEFIRRNYYHPAFNGLYSIKKVLPVLVPGMTYDALAVKNGGDAIVKHYQLASGALSEEEGRRVKSELLEYCAQDTLAMVKLHGRLIEIGAGL
jgi:hypothetical protein